MPLRRALGLLLLVACRSSEPKTPIVAPVQPSVAAAKPMVTASVVPELGVNSLRIVERDGNVQYVVAGSLRAEVTSDKISFADDRFAFAIVGATRGAEGWGVLGEGGGVAGATRVADGWVFIAADGEVARADRFLGPLTSLGQAPREPKPRERLTATCGRIAVGTSDAATSLWTTDGTGPIAPARTAPPGIVVSAAFADAGHGMIVIDGGELYATHDGMASFERVDLGTAAAARVECSVGLFRVATSSGTSLFDRGGKRLGAAGARVYPDLSELHARVMAAALRRFPELLAEAFGGLVTADHGVVFPVGTNLRALGVQAAPDELAARGNRVCTAAPWGDSLALACNTGLLRVDARTLSTAPTTPKSAGSGAPIRGDHVQHERVDAKRVVYSNDGIHAAWGCDLYLGVGFTRVQSLCMLAGRRVTRRPIGSDTLIGMRGDSVVVLRSGKQLVFVDPATGADGGTFDVALPAGAPNVNLEGFRVTPDGSTATGNAYGYDVSSSNPTQGWAIRVSLADGKVAATPLPTPVARSAFIDANRGIAAGAELSKLWVTSDGGAHWEPLATRASGTLVPNQRDNRSMVWLQDRTIACTAKRCVIDERVVVSFDDATPPPSSRVLASALPSLGQRTWTYQYALACEAHGAERRSPVLENPDDYALDAQGRSHYQRAGGLDLTLQVRATRWELAWRGRDWHGAYAVRAAGSLPDPRADTYQLKRATREGVFIFRLGSDHQYIWVPAGAKPVAIEDDSLEYAALEDAMTLPDGSLALLVEFTPRFDEAERYRRLLVVDRTGRVSRRTFFWNVDLRTVGIGVVDKTVGIHWVDYDPIQPRWFFPITWSAPKSKPALDLATLPICKGANMTDVSIYIPDIQVAAAPQVMRSPNIWRAYVRNTTPSCLQAIELDDARRTVVDGNEVFLTASPEGDLRGDLFSLNVYRSSVQEIRCKPAPK